LHFSLDGFNTYADDESAAQANDIYKLDTMIQTLQKFRDGVDLEQRRWLGRRKRR
jgi:hypothetical protein